MPHAPTPAPETALAPGVRLAPPAPTAASRVWFGWLAALTGLLSALLSPPLVVQSAFRPTARTFATWMRPWGRGILRGAGIRLRVVGSVPPGPVVFASNHQTSLDVPVTSVGLPRPFLFVARHELRSWPIVGWVLEKSACLFIRRDNPREALKSLQRAAERVRGGECVLVFPEGGRSYRHGTRPFMKGAFLLAIEAGVPVVPVALVGLIGVMDERSKVARPGAVRLVLGAPIETAGLTRRDAGALCARVQAAVDALLSEYGPLTEAA